MKPQGGQTALSIEEKNDIVSCLSLCTEWAIHWIGMTLEWW